MTNWSSNVELAVETMSVAEAKARFSAVLAAVEAGEEIVITRRGKAVARLVPGRPKSAADPVFARVTGHPDMMMLCCYHEALLNDIKVCPG